MKSQLKPKKYLFLHLGPGGSSAHERLRLARYEDQIDFWDQPTLTGDSATFRNLLDVCVERYNSKGYSGLIGHSFGGDLAQHMAGRTEKAIDEIIMLSPIRDLPLAFANFSSVMGVGEKSAADLKHFVSQRPGPTSTLAELEKFWELIQQLATNPAFLKTYWGTEENWKKHEEVLSQLPPLNMQMWQVGLSDFLLKRTPPTQDAAVKRRTVVLGDRDPYYSDISAEKKYWESRGYHVSIVAQAGHYPHIEADALSNLIAGSR